ncbi:MAG TPA: hypothetical protein VGN88_03855, partial [Phycisphaerae bacterium]
MEINRVQAVNFLLSTIGCGPIGDILESPNGARAAVFLDAISREVQSEGWSFNTQWQDGVEENNSQTIVADICLSLRQAGTLSMHEGKLWRSGEGECERVKMRAVVF